jgi:hypothetical protein
MSEQVPVSKLSDWVRKSVSTQLSQAERDRDKTLAEISRAQDSLAQICSELSKKAERDMEKRDNRAEYRATKAVVRLTTIITNLCQSIQSSPAKDTTNLRNLQRQTSKVASDAAAARQEWLRQIRPYFIIDMMTLGGHIDKLRRLGEELHSFLIGRGSVLRSLEELNEKLEALSKLELSSQSLTTEREGLEKRLEEAVREEKELRAQMESIRQNPRMKEYLQIDSHLIVRTWGLSASNRSKGEVEGVREEAIHNFSEGRRRLPAVESSAYGFVERRLIWETCGKATRGEKGNREN